MINSLFDESALEFETLAIESAAAPAFTEVKGQAIICSWPNEGGVGRSRFSFDGDEADALFSEKYHHKLLNSIDEAMAARRSHNLAPADGALLRLDRGIVSVCWVGRDMAERLLLSSAYDLTLDQLRKAYMEALQRADIATLFAEPDALSGVFLPSPSKTYFEGGPRIMVVGQETRGWRNGTCTIRNTKRVDEAGIKDSMQRTQAVATKGAQRSKFLQYYRSVSSLVSTGTADAAVWSNQFCVSFKAGSPTKMEESAFAVLKQLSYDLLRAQLEILQPQVVIFTTGPGRDKYLKECFPELETIERVEPRRLWRFRIGDIQCLRTCHPRWAAGSCYLTQAAELAVELPRTSHSPA